MDDDETAPTTPPTEPWFEGYSIEECLRGYAAWLRETDGLPPPEETIIGSLPGRLVPDPETGDVRWVPDE